jgi:hypothetical protein
MSNSTALTVDQLVIVLCALGLGVALVIIIGICYCWHRERFMRRGPSYDTQMKNLADAESQATDGGDSVS